MRPTWTGPSSTHWLAVVRWSAFVQRPKQIWAMGYFRLLSSSGRAGVWASAPTVTFASRRWRNCAWLEYGQRLTHQQRNLLAQSNSSVGSELYLSAAANGAAAPGILRWLYRAGSRRRSGRVTRQPYLADRSRGRRHRGYLCILRRSRACSRRDCRRTSHRTRWQAPAVQLSSWRIPSSH